jgi:RimJ/RimL family protein N-acetyltransferase
MHDVLPQDTLRLVLRRFERGDLPTFQSYRSDPEIARYQGWEPMTDADAVAFVDKHSRLEFGVDDQWIQIAIVLRETSELIGDIGLRVFEGGRAAEIGYTLAAAAHGRGFAVEAVAGLVDALFRDTTVARVVAVTDERNEASIRLLKRLRMRLEKTEATTFRGEPCVEQTYTLEKD